MRKETRYTPFIANFVSSRRGLGDDICSLQVFNTMTKKWPHVYGITYFPDYIVPLAKHFLAENKKIAVKPWSEMDKMRKDIPEINFKNQKLNSHRVPLMKHAFMWITDYYPEKEEMNYPVFKNGVDISEFNLPKNYACVVATASDENKQMRIETLHNIGQYFLDQGITPVYLGSHKQKLTKEKEVNFYGPVPALGVNLVDQTDLLQAASVMSKSKIVVTMDGGLMHLAACTNVPIVAGFSVVDPKLFTPQRHNQLGWKFRAVVPSDDLLCRFCQSQNNFIDFKLVEKGCFYKDFRCTEELTYKRFVSAIKKLI